MKRRVLLGGGLVGVAVVLVAIWSGADRDLVAARPDEPIAAPVLKTNEAGTLIFDVGEVAPEMRVVVPEPAAGLQANVAPDEPTPPEDAPSFFGIVVADGNDAPIADAEVTLLRRRKGYTVQADDGGRFELTATSWSNAFVRVTASGFAERLAAVVEGHDQPEEAKVIRLRPGARLTITVRDSSGRPMEGMLVRVTTDSFRLARGEGLVTVSYKPEWGATTGADGSCKMSDLPARVPLALELHRDGELVRREASPVVLGVGEVRVLELLIGAGITLHGFLLDQYDQPIANREIWMKPASGMKWGYFDDLDSLRGVTAKTKTDAAGRFKLTDVSPGKWLLGPGRKPGRWGAPPSDHLVAPEATMVLVTETPLNQDCLLHAPRGQYIRGRVLGESGEPVAAVGVNAFLPPFTNMNEMTEDDGSFAFGPVGRGKFTLSAGGDGQWDKTSVLTTAGDPEVTLWLRRGDDSWGIVRDSVTGGPVEADVRFTSPERLGWSERGTKGGKFQLRDIEDGVYNITAWTRDGKFGFLRRFNLVRGGQTEDLEVVVRPGGRIRCRYDGTKQYPSFSVSLGGLSIGGDGFHDAGTSVLVVPSGTLTVTFNSGGKTRETRTVIIAPGEEKEMVFRDAD